MSGLLIEIQAKLNGYFLGGGMNFLHAARFLGLMGGIVIATAGNLAWAASCTPLLDHRMTTLQGSPQDFCQYQGKVVLAVNTASYCGYTKQYASLEALYQKYKSRGLVVLGFPSNDFGKQEPGSNAEVADFCERTFRVKFPMFEKSRVAAGSANPFYKQLAKATGRTPQWNFHKYLVSRDGKIVKSFTSEVTPDSPAFVDELEKFLAPTRTIPLAGN
jgi:glutathione peroxidase